MPACGMFSLTLLSGSHHTSTDGTEYIYRFAFIITEFSVIPILRFFIIQREKQVVAIRCNVQLVRR